MAGLTHSQLNRLAIAAAAAACVVFTVFWFLNRPSAEEGFLDTVHEQAPETVMVDDKMLIETGRAFCDMFDAGATPQDALDLTDTYTDGVVAGAGLRHFCPEYGDEFEAHLDEMGIE